MTRNTRECCFVCFSVALLLACPASSPAPREPERETAPTAHCSGYCVTVTRCEPEHEYGNCPSDCDRLLADPELSVVSGFTAAHVRCWSEAESCALAAACDDAVEGDRK